MFNKHKKGWSKPLRSFQISFPIDLESLDALNGFLDTYFVIICLLGRELHGLFFPLSLSSSFSLTVFLCRADLLI